MISEKSGQREWQLSESWNANAIYEDPFFLITKRMQHQRNGVIFSVTPISAPLKIHEHFVTLIESVVN